MKFTQRLSLRVRLTLIFLILASVTWLLSSFVAWKQTTDNVDELFDTQLMLFAKRLSTLDLNEINAADRMAQTPNRLKHGHVDDDALTFAIFTHDGRMVLNDGDNGEDIPYSYQREGFADGQLVGEDDPWRFVWMTSPDGKYRIVVGQEWEYREDMALAIVAGQLIPWLVALPIMLIIMMVLLGRELAPLNKLALALRMRDPDSEKPLNATGVPSEVRPLVESLNQLFARTHAMMVRERRFTSDAAHELRSPLTALKVQTEVAFHQRGDHITVGVLPRPEFGFQHCDERTGADGFAGLLDIGRIKNGLRLKKIKISAFFRQFPKQGGKFPNLLKPAAVSNAQRR